MRFESKFPVAVRHGYRRMKPGVADDTSHPRTDLKQSLGSNLPKDVLGFGSREKVEVRGFGILEAKETKRTGRNPEAGQVIEIRPSRKVTFRVSKELKERLAGTRQETVAAEQNL